MSVYADTSFLFSYYASDANSPRSDVWRSAHPGPLVFTALGRLELRNAFELAVFQNRMTPSEAAAAWETVEGDIRSGLLAMTQLHFDSVMRLAEQLAASHTAQTGSRSLDILHIAAARFLNSDEIVSFDQRQLSLAGRIGLATATP